MDRDIPYIAFESVCARFERTIRYTKTIVYKGEEKIFKHIRKE